MSAAAQISGMLPRPSWPNSSASRLVQAGALTFHVQEIRPTEGDRDGANPLLLVHGTGASSHSFRAMLPLLGGTRRTVTLDLPGHGFTQGARPGDLTLTGMARALADIVSELGLEAWEGVGHSAGAAVLLQMALDQRAAPAAVTGINAALEPIRGNAVLSPLAKLLFHNPLTAHAVAFQARYSRLADRLLAGSGSQIDAVGRRCYNELLTGSAHVSGALGMMANWQLEPLTARFGEIAIPVHLIAAADDPMVPARVSQTAVRRFSDARLTMVAKGGHLWHEVDPAGAAALIAGQTVAACPPRPPLERRAAP